MGLVLFSNTLHTLKTSVDDSAGFLVYQLTLQIAVYYSSVSLVQNNECMKRRARASVCRCLLGNRTAVPSGYIIETSLLTPYVFHQIAKENLNWRNEKVRFSIC